MKYFILLLAFTVSLTAFSQSHNLNKKGIIADGYDVTEYFNNKAIEGSSKYQSNFNGATYYFASEENKKIFDANPTKYEPQYGGFCAYAIGDKNKKVDINPKSFLIEEGKLYLFYDTFFVDTKKKWLKNNPTKLRQKANEHWKNLKNQ